MPKIENKPVAENKTVVADNLVPVKKPVIAKKFVKAKKSIKGKKVAVLVEQDFEDAELTEPVAALKEAGVIVTVIGPERGQTYSGKKRQAKIQPEAVIADINSNEYDAIFIPGGYAPDKMRMHPEMVELVKRFNDQKKWVFAICHGPQMMISAGIMKGRRVTSWPSIAVDLRNAGAAWVDESVVRDRNFITSRKPADIPHFNKAIIEALEKRPVMIKGETRPITGSKPAIRK